MFTSMEATCSNGLSSRYAMKISDQHYGKKRKFQICKPKKKKKKKIIIQNKTLKTIKLERF